jgi:cell division protein FtsW (lipid II flippase)
VVAGFHQAGDLAIKVGDGIGQDGGLDPATAWQPRQAMNAVGSGRFIGKGFLQGTQIRLGSLPALWTDFPFAVWAEEWGFIGCTAVLLAYGLLVLWVLKIGREARDRFGITVCEARTPTVGLGG